MHKFPYEWSLSDGYPAKGIEAHGLKVFGTFINGGGSSMGYKLAGYDHIGGVEIDPRIAEVYKLNHKPTLLYVDDIRAFNERSDLPSELYELDILDGSPPCSTFSMSGSREAAWGKEKEFREGQKMQTLDDLVFVYAETINKLRPKVAILENVKGMVQGNAKAYAAEVIKKLNGYGYDVQVFLLNSASMGVPQRRERVFFVCSRKDLGFKKLTLNFNEKPINYNQIEDDNYENKIENCDLEYFNQCKAGNAISSVHPKGNRFNSIKLHPNKPVNTIASGSCLYHYIKEKSLSNKELALAGSYPLDYHFANVKPQYLIGMSVPPLMIAHISHEIYMQWLKPLQNKKG